MRRVGKVERSELCWAAQRSLVRPASFSRNESMEVQGLAFHQVASAWVSGMPRGDMGWQQQADLWLDQYLWAQAAWMTPGSSF